MATRLRVFVARSLDGLVAGPDEELDWLSLPALADDTFTPLFAQIGAVLRGRRTYDVSARERRCARRLCRRRSADPRRAGRAPLDNGP